MELQFEYHFFKEVFLKTRRSSLLYIKNKYYVIIVVDKIKLINMFL